MVTFLVLLLAYTLSQFYRSFLAVVSADLTRDLGLDPAGLGTLSAIWFIAFALAQFPVGYALDRFGPRRTLALTMIAAVAGAAWLARASGFTDAAVALALIGIGCSPIYMSSLFIVARTAPHRFALLSALILGIGSLGNILGTTPLVLAAEHFGWRAAFAGIAAATAASALSVWILVRDPDRPETGRSGGSMLGGIAAILRIGTLWLLLPLAFVSYASVIATRSLWIAPYLTATHGLAPEPLGNAVLAMAIAMSLGAMASGALARPLGAKLVTACGIVVAAACFGALGLGAGRNEATSVVLLTGAGFFGMTYAVLMEHGRSFVPPGLIGRGMTVMNFAFIGGSGVLQWLSGHAVQAWLAEGLPPPEAYRRLFLAFGAILVVTLAVYLFAPARPRGDPAATRPEPAP